MSLRTSQIVRCTTHHQTLLAEVIQVLRERSTCWVRPLVLVDNSDHHDRHCIDVRSCSDLILPISYFEPALDTEILPLLDYLAKDSQSVTNFQANHLQVTLFLRELLH